MQFENVSPAERHAHVSRAVAMFTALATAAVSGGIVLLVGLFGPLSAATFEAWRLRGMAAALVFVVALLVVYLVRRGYVRQGAILLGSVLFIALLAMPIGLQVGVHSAGLPLLAVLVMFAGFSFSPRAAAGVGMLGIVAVLGIYGLEAAGLLRGPTPETTPPAVVLASTVSILLLLVGWLTTRYAQIYQAAIADLESSGRALQATLDAKRASAAKLRESEERHRLVLEHSPAGIFGYDQDFVLTYCNPRLSEILRAPRDYLVGFDMKKLVDQRPLQALQSVLEGRDGRYEGPYRTTYDGQDIWVQLASTPLRDAAGTIRGGIAIIEDITERKRGEDALREAKEAAEAANRAKGSFLATMSHEIRTPLNGVLGMAQLLMMSRLDESERQDAARTILTSGQSLLTLLNDILDLSKVESGKFELVPSVFDPHQIVAETADLFNESARAKGLLLDASWHGPEARYRADPQRLRQMLANLVGNAIKFTAQGVVRVEARELEREDNQVMLEFAVTDSGVGIPADKLDLLFKPFTQVDNSNTRAHGGTGLGLSIVRGLAHLMGGTTGVESRPGEETRFWFRIRAEVSPVEAESRRAQRIEAPATSLSGRILVVEDNPSNRTVVGALLDQFGLQVDFAENGAHALEMLQAGGQPDLVMMDVQMPVMDGIEATRQIRRREAENGAPPLPIVALTARVYAEDRQRCLASGMNDFLCKPVEVEMLGRVLARWLPPGANDEESPLCAEL